jgi:hypothetical protein
VADDPEDLAPPSGAGAGSKRITCEFCECALANSGDVLRRSARAKALMELEEQAEAANTELEELRGRVSTLEQQLAAETRKVQELEAASKKIKW